MDTNNDDLKNTIELDEKGRPTKKWLEWAYLEKGLSTLAIAELTGRVPSGIWWRMKQLNIPLRQSNQLDRDWLEQKYVVEQLPLKEIAEQANMPAKNIPYWIKFFGFPLRAPKKAKTLERPSREWVVQKYSIEKLPIKQICEMTGYTRRMFSDLLDAYGIQHNNKSRVKAIPLTEEELYQLHVVEGLTAVRIAARFGYHSSGVSRLIKKYNLDPGRPLVNEKKLPPLTHDELWKLYWVDNMSAGQIATRYNVTRSTALRWFKQLEIPTRDWNGGKDFHRTYTRNTGDRREQEFNAIERNQILTRDQWHCQMPGCDCKEAWKLEVHHIMPIEYGGTNALANGITLCKNCHDSIRLRELDFITLFQEILQQQNN